MCGRHSILATKLKSMKMFHRTLFIFLLYSINVFSQSKENQTFKLVGVINSDTGTVTLRQVAFSDFYPGIKTNISAKVNNGRFVFEGSLKNPLGFEIIYNNSYWSDLFVIEPGIQEISIDLNSVDKTPKVGNGTMKERNEYLLAFSQLEIKRKLFDKKYDSLVTLYKRNFPENIKLEIDNEISNSYKENDELLLKYVQTHPDSYLALWKLVRLNIFGYEDVFHSIFNAFDKTLKNSQTGKMLLTYLERQKRISIGAKFPKIKVVDTQNKKNGSLLFGKKFTLIDFWYSSCLPCIAQFEDLKKINEKYSSQFEIVGISTDKFKYKQDWLNVIKTKELTWRQYWDCDGNEATKLQITTFPTNLLVNADGEIIKKNIKPAQLEEFLRNNIATQ